ncbi:ribosomal protein S18-alanine N-acetyltransferase [Lachnospiraceae bacterium ASD3451]|nr:ribosomal protein S18-alanine N-acetyltransferase [Diplocloster agilis]
MLTIRPMEAKDLKQVTAIERETFSVPWSEKAFADSMDLPYTLYLVAETPEGRIAGYCGLYQVFSEGEITNVAVAFAQRRQGVAGTMLTRLLEQGKQMGIESFFLEVRQSNLAARRLYEKLGFSGNGTRKNFYEKPREDAVIMWKH